MSTDSLSAMSGPPYAPRMASLGSPPTIIPDVPITAVFMAMYLACAITSITIFRKNLKRGHKFILSGLITGFCMARVLTGTLRIVWAAKPNDVSVGIAAALFNNLGVFLLYIINLIFAQRILRARKPRLGWSRPLHWALVVAYSLIAVVAILVITFTVLSYYTRDSGLLTAVRDVQLAAGTYLMVFVMLPYLFLLAAYVPDKAGSEQERQDFGHASVHHKTVILIILTKLMVLAQGFKYGTQWVPNTYPVTSPPWYFSKTCFYTFGFMLEILWVLVALSQRIDLKFHVPNGSSKRRTYLVEEKLEDHNSVGSV